MKGIKGMMNIETSGNLRFDNPLARVCTDACQRVCTRAGGSHLLNLNWLLKLPRSDPASIDK